MSLKLGLYQHYKGGRYRVIGIAKHSETLEDLVVYEPQCETEVKLWVRPLAKFIEKVNVDGRVVDRFSFIGMAL